MTSHLADPEHNPSFTRGVFLGEIREDLVFPFPELAPGDRENLNAILDSFRAWSAATVDSARMDREGRFPDEVRKGAVAYGVLRSLQLRALRIPKPRLKRGAPVV